MEIKEKETDKKGKTLYPVEGYSDFENMWE